MKEMLTLLEMNAEDILRYTAEQLRGLGELHTDGKEYVYLHTGHPLALMAHVDTVGIKACKPIMKRNVITNSVEGEPLGADDRAGVFAALETVRRLRYTGDDIPNIIFTNHEECGSAGATALLAAEVFVPEGLRLILALDRRGANDYVWYTPQPPQVKDYVEEFGFCSSHGSYNDVKKINEKHRIPGVNLSVGYYSQHTARERLHMDELFLTITRLVRMCKSPIEALYPLKEEDVKPKVYTYAYGAGFRSGDYYDDYGGYGDEFTPSPYASIYAGGQKTPSKQWPNKNPNGKPQQHAAPARGYVVSQGELEEHDDEETKTHLSSADERREMINLLLDLTDMPTSVWAEAGDTIKGFVALVTDEFDRCASCGTLWQDCICGEIVTLAIEELTFEELRYFCVEVLTPADDVFDEILEYLLIAVQDGDLCQPDDQRLSS